MLKGTILLELQSYHSAAMTIHRQACHQDMQWMAVKWHVEVVAVRGSKETPHNTRDVLSSNALLTYLLTYSMEQSPS
jgi:hypothetical protein